MNLPLIYLIVFALSLPLFADSGHGQNAIDHLRNEWPKIQARNAWENYMVCLAKAVAKKVEETRAIEKVVTVKEAFLKNMSAEDKLEFKRLHQNYQVLEGLQSNDREMFKLVPQNREAYILRQDGYDAELAEISHQVRYLKDTILNKAFKGPAMIDGKLYDIDCVLYGKESIGFRAFSVSVGEKIKVTANLGLCGNAHYPDGREANIPLPEISLDVDWNFSLAGGEGFHFFKVTKQNGSSGTSQYSQSIHSMLNDIFGDAYDTSAISTETDKTIDKIRLQAR